MGPLYVGIDVGTSNIKICVFNCKREIVSYGSRDTVVLSPKEGYMEIDLKDVLSKVVELLRIVVEGYEQDVVSIGFSVTSPTIVLLDKSLKPLRPGILYLDNRSSLEVHQYAEKLGGEKKYFSRVGNKPSPSTCSVGILNWLKKNEAEIWAKVYKVGYLNTFLAGQFTGNLAVDPTTASYSGLMAVGNPDKWDEELIDLSGINSDLLPNIRPSFYKIGTLRSEIAQETGLRQEVSVAIGSADTAASSFALGLKRHGDVFESIGTSEVITFCLDKPLFDVAFMNRSHVIPGYWLAHGAISTSGAAINWLMNNVFVELDNTESVEREALRSTAGANGVIFLPYLSGERSPIFDPNTFGVFFGLTLNTNRSSIIRAVYEGTGYAMKQLYLIAQPKFIRCVGGAASSKLVLQMRADILNVPYKSMEAGNIAAYGAAMLGAIAAKHYSIDNTPFINKSLMTINPNVENTKIYDKLYKIYESLYPNLKEAMHEMKRFQAIIKN
jgi:xylulokinase